MTDGTEALSYESKAVRNTIAQLCGCAAFQELVGVANEDDPAEAARAFVIELDGGTPGRTSGQGSAIACDGSSLLLKPPYAVVGMEQLDPELAGVASFDFDGDTFIELHLVRLVGDETPPQSLRRGKNILGLVAEQCRARFGATGCLGTGTAGTSGPFLPDESGGLAKEMIGDVNLKFTG